MNHRQRGAYPGAQRAHAARRGEKYALAWSKYLPTRTNITLATWYYRTSDYITLSESVMNNDRYQRDPAAHSRQAMSVSLSQPLGENGGRLAMDAWFRDYRGGRSATRQYNLSYSNHFQYVNYVISAGRSRYTRAARSEQQPATHHSETTFQLSFSMPFSLFGSSASVNARTRYNNGRYNTSSLGFSGTNQDVDYSLDVSHNREGNAISSDLYAGWRTDIARLNAGVSSAADYHQYSVGASGSVLAWRHGLLATPEAGTNFVVVEAPGVEGAVINSDPHQRTNQRGQALVSGAASYRMNQFWLDTSDSQNPDVDVLGNVGHVAPYEGSITRVKYRTDTRKVFVLPLKHPDNALLAFGTVVYNAAGDEVAMWRRAARPTSNSTGCRRYCVLAARRHSHPASSSSRLKTTPIFAPLNRSDACISDLFYCCCY